MSSAEESPAPSEPLGLGRHSVGREDAGEECGPAVPSLGTSLLHGLGHSRTLLLVQQNRAGDAHTQQEFALAAPARQEEPARATHPPPPARSSSHKPTQGRDQGLEKLRCLDPLRKHFEGAFRRLCPLRKGTWSCTTSLQFVSDIWMGRAPTALLCSSPSCLQVWPGFPRGDT